MSALAITLNIMRLPHAHDLPLPSYATTQSAGLDLAAAIDRDIVLEKGERVLVPTGFSIALSQGYEAQIRPRSGLALKHGLTVLNSPGTIDADYRGELKVILINLGQSSFTIERSMRIAQLVIAPVSSVSWQEVESFTETERRGNGFGSTGLKTAV
jgi:dUTP pyrophosphatase